MKKIITTLFLAYIGNFSAQSVVSKSNFLPIGSKLSLSYADTSTFKYIDATLTGENQTWDFSKLIKTPNSNDLNLEIVDPKNTPYKDSFPTSNYGYKETKGSAITYRYFNLSNDSLARLGSFGTSFKKYYDPQVEFVFPLAYGTKHKDTWTNSASSFGGTYDLDCNGKGKLILPSGTHDVLFVTVTANEGGFESEVYFWYDAKTGAVLAEVVSSLFGTTVLFANSDVTGIDEAKLVDFTFNNPVNDQLKITFNSTFDNNKLQINIFNFKGQLVSSNSNTIITNNTCLIATNELEKGIYLLTISENNGITRNLRFVKD